MSSSSAGVLKPQMADHVREVKTKIDKGRTFDEKIKTIFHIKLSYAKAGTSELGMAVIGVKRTSADKVTIGYAMYCETWKEQKGVNLVDGEWDDSDIQKFLTIRLLKG